MQRVKLYLLSLSELLQRAQENIKCVRFPHFGAVKKKEKKKRPTCLKAAESSAAKMQNRSSGVICAGGAASPAVDPHRSSDGCTPEAHFDKDCG